MTSPHWGRDGCLFSEKSLYGGGKIEEAIESLKNKNLIYEGIFGFSQG